MASAETLEDKLKRLEGELRLSKKMCHDLEQQDRSHDNIVVNYSKDRKISKFSDKNDIDEWSKNVNLYVTNKFRSEQEKVHFILDHLEDAVKLEIRLEIDPEKSSSTELLDLLTNLYSVKESIFELQHSFYERKQQSGESLNDYSRELMRILYLMKKKDPATYKDTETILKERFAEGVRDLSLRRELKRLNDESTFKFFQLRDRAVSWMKDAESDTQKLDSLVEMISLQKQQQELISIQQQQIQTLNDKMSNHSEQVQKVAEIAEHISSQKDPNFRYRGRGRSRGRGRGIFHHVTKTDSSSIGNPDSDKSQNSDIICHYCSLPNHIAPQCWKKRQDLKMKAKGKMASN